MLRVLAPIWLTKPETARRVRQRIGTVLDWAKAAGHRSGENPIEGVAKGLPKQGSRDEHHAALPYAQVPLFIARLREADASEGSRLAFEFLVLTAARTSEVLGARWDEISVADRIWTVPAVRMKAKREHRVPLSERTLAILARGRELAAGSPLVFPGRSGEKPLSNMVFLMLLRRMELQITAHGFRSSFRDWAGECTSLPREVAELALAHAVESRVEAAYARSDLLERRRQLMQQWSEFMLAVEAKKENLTSFDACPIYKRYTNLGGSEAVGRGVGRQAKFSRCMAGYTEAHFRKKAIATARNFTKVR